MLITLLLWVIFGALVGWIAGKLMKSNNSLLLNIILGIVGSLVGGFIASRLGFADFGAKFSFNIVNIIISVAGACLVIFIARLLTHRK
ncbi:MAG: GlsB/YeaQ/YmgE family stress response membrane protein [Firmicutes bacterium]|nr:GlsB/YeaQ/YmgE family stress response membrane protein [Bacillota bacterium]